MLKQNINLTGEDGGLQLGRTQEGNAKEARGMCLQPGLQSHSIPSIASFEALHVPSPQFTILHARPANTPAFQIMIILMKRALYY